ncbi:MAG: ATP-binding protein [Spirochaetales bacterium]|nr:ATP-binding protein [Spirochaetales bacterium]
MNVYPRILDLQKESEYKSLFLFGPRQTGKTFYLKQHFPESEFYNLLLSDLFLRLTQRPQLLREELLARGRNLHQPVIIDEIQKLPILLDEIHYLIEEHNIRFIITGSSPRKLLRGGANLLGGRARTRHLFPLVSKEIPDLDLVRALNYGTIPSIYLSPEPEEDLLAYCGNYLKEEIQAEGAVRRIENFSRFLQTAAIINGEMLKFEAAASDLGMPARTVREYFHILEDTLVGILLKPYRKTKKRKPVSNAKFYFFDTGVSNSLAGRCNIRPKTELFGKALEHFIFTEIRAYLSYKKDRRELSFWHTYTGYEVDFLIGNEIGIEVKGSETITEKHLKGLLSLSGEIPLKKKIVVSNEPRPRKIDDILILPVPYFLDSLWGDEFAGYS